MKPLFLVGYMGCGKSTLGRKLARRLGVAFADTDQLVEQQEGASVCDIFHYEGEEHFRQLERGAVEGLIGRGGEVVVSTGGGLPIWRDNIERLNASGTTIYLRRTAEQIARRLTPYGRQKRPRLRGLDDGELVEFMRSDMVVRGEFYAKSHFAIDCASKTDEQLLEEILELIKNNRLG